MTIFNRIMGISITIFISFICFFFGIKSKTEGKPNSLYQVYLNGDKIGLIEDKEALLDLIDQEQIEIKEKFKVNKVYPPNGLDIRDVITYENEVSKVPDLYQQIKNKEPFTISGYEVVINYKNEEEIGEDGEKIEPKEPISLYVLNKEDFITGFYNTIAAFVGSDVLDKYKNDNQMEIADIGSIIENIYWDEDIKIKESLLSTSDYIFTNSSDISKYLLFGTLEEGKKYIVRDGDNIRSVANANNLNVDEFLVANPEFTSENVLLTRGQEVNTALISPLVSIIYEEEKVEDVEVPYETEYQDDDTLYQGNNQTLQEGENGLTRVKERIQYKNGEIQGLVITSKTELVPAVNKIVKRGTRKVVVSGGYEYYSISFTNDSWYWPTITPYVITSRFEYRWGRMHEGIDISGCGYGSPIFSVGNGVVVEAGYLSSQGNYIYVSHGNDTYTIYMHLAKIGVKVGQEVRRGEQIGTMGSTGRSTGTHLHFGISYGYPYKGGNIVNPCGSLFSC